LSDTWDHEIELGNLTETIDHGEPVKSQTWTTVLANLLDDNRSEFYQAASAGLKPELTFQVHDFEFNNVEYVRYLGNVYNIIRAPKRGEFRELVISSYPGVEPNG
jgi:SPP1 family predicted phage head-tail adaptor